MLHGPLSDFLVFLYYESVYEKTSKKCIKTTTLSVLLLWYYSSLLRYLAQKINYLSTFCKVSTLRGAYSSTYFILCSSTTHVLYQYRSHIRCQFIGLIRKHRSLVLDHSGIFCHLQICGEVNDPNKRDQINTITLQNLM